MSDHGTSARIELLPVSGLPEFRPGDDLAAAIAAAAPWLQSPDVRKAEPGTRTAPEAVEGGDVYAWPHNETSTGVMAPVRRVASSSSPTRSVSPRLGRSGW